MAINFKYKFNQSNYSLNSIHKIKGCILHMYYICRTCVLHMYVFVTYVIDLYFYTCNTPKNTTHVLVV